MEVIDDADLGEPKSLSQMRDLSQSSGVDETAENTQPEQE